jgi:hypothetical protein
MSTEEMTAAEVVDAMEAGEWQAPEPEGYSIAKRAGQDLSAQMTLASWHAQKAAECQAVTDAILAPHMEELTRLESEAARIRQQAEEIRNQRRRDFDWHVSQVRFWFESANIRETTGQATLKLPYVIVKSVQSRGTTQVNKTLVLELAAKDPEAWGHLVKPMPDDGGIRKLYELKDGRVLTKDGEIIEQEIIVQVEPPHLNVDVQITGDPGEGEA